jgi:hypothetical protein
MKTKTLTEHVCRISEEIWGEQWCPQASDALDIDIRTLKSIRSAAQSGEESLSSGDAFARIEEFTVRILKMVGAAHATLGADDGPAEPPIKP